MPLLNDNKSEEDKSFALRWYHVRNRVRDEFGDRPDINAMLFLIGINELGVVKDVWEKEEKEQLMHVAVCRLMSEEGYYTFTYTDDEGWPHYELNTAIPKVSLKEQDELLKRKIVEYFENL